MVSFFTFLLVKILENAGVRQTSSQESVKNVILTTLALIQDRVASRAIVQFLELKIKITNVMG